VQPEVVHGEVQLGGGGEEEVHGLRGAEQRHHPLRLPPLRKLGSWCSSCIPDLE